MSILFLETEHGGADGGGYNGDIGDAGGGGGS